VPSLSRSGSIDLREIAHRNDAARHIVAGFRAAMPTLAEIWQYLGSALDDAPTLSGEITRLSAELRRTRLDRANLLAAMRATIATHADGEPDPMWYLRDELAANRDATRERL
jgi:hypothetical protein